MKKLSKALKTVPGLLCCHELEHIWQVLMKENEKFFKPYKK